MRIILLFCLLIFMISCSENSGKLINSSSDRLQHQSIEQATLDEIDEQNIKPNPSDRIGQTEEISAMYGYLQGAKCQDGHIFNGMHLFLPSKDYKFVCDEINPSIASKNIELFVATSTLSDGSFNIVSGESSDGHELYSCNNCNEGNSLEANVLLKQGGQKYYFHDGTVTVSNLKNVSEVDWIDQDSIQVKIDGMVNVDGVESRIEKNFFAQPCENLFTSIPLSCLR